MNILQKRIKEASQKYYSDGTSDLSDAEFDEMLDTLRKEDPNSPLLGVGHGYTVDEDSTVGQRVKHKYGRAGSLEKCHNWDEIPKDTQKFLSPSCSLQEWASLKLDGLSVVLYYHNGCLAQALTRGGGEYGIDITPKVKIIERDNEQLQDSTFTGAVRGEIVMSYDNFEVYKEAHPEAKNPRNTAAGLINSKEFDSNELQLLDIVVYTVVGIEDVMNTPSLGYTEVWSWLENNFSKVAPHHIIYADDEIFMSCMEHLQHKWYGIYPADGIVLASNSLIIESCTDNPYAQSVQYNSVAFKFKAEAAITKVIDVEWNLTKTKCLVPRINVEEVELSGTNVSWATGFNALNIKEQKLGPGAVVSILKSGEIIPHIEEVIEPVEPVLPDKCPCCGTKLEWSGVHLQCPNMECADKDVQDVLVWMKFVAPWDGLGDTLKLKYLGEMFGEDISIDSIYLHGMFKESEIQTQYVKKTEFRKMFNALFTNQVKLSSAIQALNIPRFGEVTSAKAAQYPEIILDAIQGRVYNTDKLRIGEANFESLAANISKFQQLNYIRDRIIWKSQSVVGTKGKVAITGKLSVKRSIFEEELRNAGYVPGNIAKDTEFLITDDPTSNSSKNAKADEWNIQKITEEEFRQYHM